MLDAFLNHPIVDTFKTILAFIVAISILITVHEFGHFWVARRCGVQVLRFSLGFGKRLWGRTDKHGTEFIIALIPLGGYVKMLDERAEDVAPELRQQAFNNKSISQRAAIISAGPLANFLFAGFAFWLVLMMGQLGLKPIIGEVLPGSIAARAGIEPRMELKSVAGIQTLDWSSAQLALISQAGNVDTELTLLPAGKTIVERRRLDLSQWNFQSEPSGLKSLGIVILRPMIGLNSVLENSAAERGGLKKDDKIVSVNGQLVKNDRDFIQIVQQNPQRELNLDIERAAIPQILTVIPDEKIVLENGSEKVIGSLGVTVTPPYFSKEYLVTIKYGPFEALYPAGKQTWQFMTLVVKELGNLLIGNRDFKSLSGPGTIAKEARASAENGMTSFLMFLVVISVNLGIINLFPLPVLDGGHLLFLAIEKVIGKPVSERVQDYSFRFGAILLILLIGLTFFN